MTTREIRQADLCALLGRLAQGLGAPARVYLVAATSQLAEGWRDAVPQAELAGDAEAQRAATWAAGHLGLALVWESPEDVIPLPAGHVERARPVAPHVLGAIDGLEVRHFDPYSVVLRLVARGDEPDYVAALEYLRHGWVAFDHLEALLDEVLPRFTNATLQQDPAEFRRKFRGLRQLWRATGPAAAAAAPSA